MYACLLTSCECSVVECSVVKCSVVGLQCSRATEDPGFFHTDYTIYQ